MRPPLVWWRTIFPAIAQSTGQTLRDRPSALQFRTLTIPQSTARSVQLPATSRRTLLGQAWEISRRSSGRIFAIGLGATTCSHERPNECADKRIDCDYAPVSQIALRLEARIRLWCCEESEIGQRE